MVGRLDPTPTFVFTLPPAPTIAWRSPWRQTRYVKGGVCCRQPSIIIWQSNPYPLSRLSMHVCLVVYRMITSMCIPIWSAALGRASRHTAHRLHTTYSFGTLHFPNCGPPPLGTNRLRIVCTVV